MYKDPNDRNYHLDLFLYFKGGEKLKTNYDLTLYNILKKNLSVCKLTTSKDETIIRCPFCGDSQKNFKDAHLYINNLPPFKFYCQKCNTSGIANSELLSNVNIFDNDLNKYLKESKSEYLKKINVKYGGSFLSYFNNNEKILVPNSYEEKELEKLSYIENRLGISINDEEDIRRYKIILNIEDFYRNNDIDLNLPNIKNKIKDLENNFVGFLLNDNNMITFRRIYQPKTEEEDRYYNHKIFQDTIFTSRKFFTIGNELDLSNDIININMTEGIFDIIGVFNHIYNGKINSNDVFVSCNGKSYNFVLNYLKSLSVLNCNINIYSDNDVPISKFQSMKKYNKLMKYNGINLFYNKLEKDFGIKKERIKLIKREV